MSKRSSKKTKRRSKALPALGFAGVSFSMASGACASISEASANTPPTSPTQSRQIFLGEEEISDVSLATFYVSDKENDGSSLAQRLRLARGGCGGCGGCHGCGGGGGCHGCGGGGGCHVGCAGGGAFHAGCAGGGCHVGCAVGGCRCGGGIHVGCAGVGFRCAGGCHFGCRACRCGGGFFFGGCGGCGGCAATCWIWVPAFGWIFTCGAEATPPAPEASSVVASTQSAPATEPVAKDDGIVARVRTE
jgi:hypothetical protein